MSADREKRYRTTVVWSPGPFGIATPQWPYVIEVPIKEEGSAQSSRASSWEMGREKAVYEGAADTQEVTEQETTGDNQPQAREVVLLGQEDLAIEG